MEVEIVYHRVDPFNPGVDPALDRAEEIDPVRSGAARVSFGEGLPCGRPEGAEDITFATSAVVDFLLGPLRFGTRRFDHAPAGSSFPGRLRSHLRRGRRLRCPRAGRCRAARPPLYGR